MLACLSQSFELKQIGTCIWGIVLLRGVRLKTVRSLAKLNRDDSRRGELYAHKRYWCMFCY